jgi:hypothetical protein
MMSDPVPIFSGRFVDGRRVQEFRKGCAKSKTTYDKGELIWRRDLFLHIWTGLLFMFICVDNEQQQRRQPSSTDRAK